MEKDPITDKCALDTAQLLFDACGSNTELALQTLHRHRATDEDDALTEFRQAVQQQLQTLTNASSGSSATESEKNGFSQNSDAEQKVIDAIAENEVVAENINEVFDDQLSFGDRVADRVASFGGSWTFILTFVGIMVVWIAINTLALINPNVFPSFDPYPFILLNLGLSSLAALQAPIIMMSQNRQSEKDRLKVEQNYAVSLKTDLQIIDMQKKLDDFHMALLDSRKSEL